MPSFSADLAGQTAVVTGTSSGIGRAVAELYLQNGAEVIGIQRRPSGISHERYHDVTADLANPSELAEATSSILENQRVDILVNNAGINIRHRFEEFPADDWDQVLQINLRTVMELIQIFGRPMLERGEGTVINMASMLCFFGGFKASAYAASKGALGQLTKSIANEWAPRGVNVNAIAPGFIDTEMNVALLADETRERQIRERIPAGRWGRPEDIAGAALFLASGAARYVHGVVLPVDGGYLSR